jgi:subtilisin family serine protease
MRSGEGGDFGGAGASGDWDAAGASADSAGSALGDLAGGALEAAGSADEGAVVIVPVVALFLIGAAVLTGAGALAWLYFGWEVLLAVAVELAFSVATARAAMGVEQAGWLSAAVRLTWKPLLGAVLCAVALGAAIDHFIPHAQSLPDALRILRGR